MPFEIVRNDIVNMQVDAVVNTANPNPVIGSGVDSGIHKKAGHELLATRQKIGCIEFGDAVITPGFGLDAKYVIHTVGPIWEDGNHGEEQILSSCYRKSLALSKEHECESIAFPLIATGNYGFPKPLALQIAVREISTFLLESEMQLYLVVFGKEAFALSEKLFKSVSSYIDENYIRSKTLDEYGTESVYSSRLETVGGAIHHIGNVHKYARKEDVPEKTLFIITTDGMENASHRYTYDKVRHMIERQKERYGWEFLFLGANIDAAAEARRFGIDESMAANYHCDEVGTALNYEVISEAITNVRACAAPLSADWKKKIDADYKKRGGKR